MSSFSLESIWRALGEAHEPAAAGTGVHGTAFAPGQAGGRHPGPFGLDGVWSFARSNAARVMRLRHAIAESGPLAMDQLQRLLGAISLADVRQVLVTLARDIAVVWCGSVILGTGLGALAGALGGGVGAVPGAALGAEAGAATGDALLALFGLKALAESMASSMPRALRAWNRGAHEAWDDMPFGDESGHETFQTRQAAWDLAQGHLALLEALLMALLAVLARGGMTRALALHEISANGRLGPAVARWLDGNEGPLRQALARAGRSSESDTRRPAAAPAPGVTPSRLRAATRSGKAGANEDGTATTGRAAIGNVEGVPDAVARARLRQQAMLQDNVGYNISPTAWDEYPTIGRNGTFISDRQGVMGYFGDTGDATEITVSKDVAAQIEADMGLVPGTLQDGFTVRRVTGIKDMEPASPMEGNQYFQGPGNHLPGGAPEMVVKSISTADTASVTTVLKVKVGP